MTGTAEYAISAARDVAGAQSLTAAFRCFTEAAESLKCSYHQLEGELARLRHELEERNSELARSLEENRRMRDSLHEILKALPCGVLVMETDGCLSLLNPAAARLLGVAEVSGGSERLPRGIHMLLERAKQNAGEWELQIGIAPSETRSIAVRHTVLGKGQQESVFLLEDVSEHKRIEREREGLERQRALAELAAILAHEIRNPLGSLELFAGLLAEADLEDERRNWVEQLQAGLRTLAATVNNVLHFHNQPRPELASSDVGQILGWVCDFLRPLAKQSGVELGLENRLAGTEFRADRHRLEQVLLNLAINGLRFTPAGGHICISGQVVGRGENAEIELRVSDTGPGILPESLPQIFRPGYTTRHGSPGLGLTVCKTIVEQHGGKIFASNRPEGGAMFVLRFPWGGKQ